MKKMLFANVFLIILIFLFSIGQAATAQDEKDTGTLAGSLEKTAKETGLAPEVIDETPALTTIVGKYIGVLMGFIGIAFLIYMLYGGLLWMTAGGEMKTISQAKTTMINAAVGLAVTLLAYQVASYAIRRVSEATQ